MLNLSHIRPYEFVLPLVVFAPYFMALVALVVDLYTSSREAVWLIGFWTAVCVAFVAGASYSQFSLASSQLQWSVNIGGWLGLYNIALNLGTNGLTNTLLAATDLAFVFAYLGSRERDADRAVSVIMFLLLLGSLNGILCSTNIFLITLFTVISCAVVMSLAYVLYGERLRHAIGAFILLAFVLTAALITVLYSAQSQTSLLSDVYSIGLAPKQQFVNLSLFGIAALILLGSWPFGAWYRNLMENLSSPLASVFTIFARALAAVIIFEIILKIDIHAMVLLQYAILSFGILQTAIGSLRITRSDLMRDYVQGLLEINGGAILMSIGTLTASGFIAAALFFVVSIITTPVCVYTANHIDSRVLRRPNVPITGIVNVAPWSGWSLALGSLGLVGLPGLGGFVALGVLLAGSFNLPPYFMVPVGMVLVLSLVGCLYRCFVSLFGRTPERLRDIGDLRLGVRALAVASVAALMWIGIMPSGPKVASIPILESGIVNVISNQVFSLSTPYLSQIRGVR
jgi:formate hydrogenlyase subunit 3/multisubunit Na+/H+ antiporter MnhD subunit